MYKKLGGKLRGKWVKRETGNELGDQIRKLGGTGLKRRKVGENVTGDGTSLWRKS